MSAFWDRVDRTGLLGSKPLPITKAHVSSNKMTNLMRKKIISILKKKKSIYKILWQSHIKEF